MRTIDDFRASGVNNILSAGDMAIPGNLAPALACVALFKRLEHGRILNVTSADFARAYKHAPRDGISKGVCDKSRDGGGGLFSESLGTLPIGCRRAPAYWGRVAAFAKFAQLKLSGATVFVFSDDCFVIEPCGARPSAL